MSICIFGQKENGKSTLASILVDKLSPTHHLTRVSFARPIKETLSVMTGWSVAFLDSIKDDTPPKWNCTVREAYQRIGDVGRGIRQDIYTSRALEIPKGVIDDARFENEFYANADGYNILLIRPSHLNNDPHNSETWVGEQARMWLALAKDNPSPEFNVVTTYPWDRIVINDFESVEEWAERSTDLIAELRQWLMTQ